jgi:hypothetical protein
MRGGPSPLVVSASVVVESSPSVVESAHALVGPSGVVTDW